jgi:hypothetical protein
MMLSTLRFLTTFPKQLPDMLSKYHAEIAKIKDIPVEGLSDEELVAIIGETVYGSTRKLLDYDFLLIAVIKRVYHFLGLLLEPYFGEQAEALRGKLISVWECDHGYEHPLWDLAQFAKASQR